VEAEEVGVSRSLAGVPVRGLQAVQTVTLVVLMSLLITVGATEERVDKAAALIKEQEEPWAPRPVES